MKEFKFSDRQAAAILEMKLQKLAGLERKQIENELKEKKELIAHLKALLADTKKILAVVKDELVKIREQYGDDRKTRVVASEARIMAPEDLIEEKDAMLVLTRGGYVKRTDPSEYRKQKRGGVGVIDLNTKEEDFVTTFVTTSTHSDLLFFTDRGKAYQIKMYEIPEGKRATKGKSVVNFISLEADERVTSVLAMPKTVKEMQGLSLFMVTKQGTAKKYLRRVLKMCAEAVCLPSSSRKEMNYSQRFSWRKGMILLSPRRKDSQSDLRKAISAKWDVAPLACARCVLARAIF